MCSSDLAGDFDGDGRMDLVLGNRGANSHHEVHGWPMAAFHGDLDGDGVEDVFMAYRNRAVPEDAGLASWLPMHGLGTLAGAVPELRERFKSHRAFAMAHLGDVLGPNADRMKRVVAHWNLPVVLLHRADHWDVRPLPWPAASSASWGIAIADWNGDGHEDLFVAQNDFHQNHGQTRDDAGLGLVLLGDGGGAFQPLSSRASGIRILGEGRAVAVADPDADGRPDLFVTTVEGPTLAYRNRTGRPGLRVRLMGPPGNPLAAGARVRWTHDASRKAGPAREWHLGSGHGGCDSAIHVIARPVDGDGTLDVTWPGGRTQRVAAPKDARGVRIPFDKPPEVER